MSESSPLANHPAPRHYRFAEPSEGSVAIAESCRAGILRYVVPVAATLSILHLVVTSVTDVATSPLAYVLFALSSASFVVERHGRRDLAIATFVVGSFALLATLCWPGAAQANGFAVGAAYTFCLYPVMCWLCFADRRARLAAIAITAAILAAILWAGQPADVPFRLPAGILTMALVQCYFIIAITLGLLHGFERAIRAFNERWRRAFVGQEELNVQLGRRSADLQREASAHLRTLQDLRRSEVRYRKLFDSAFDGIIVFDGERGLPLEVNAKFAAILGYSRAELLELPPVAVSPRHQPDGRTSVEARAELRARLDAGEAMTYVWTHLDRGGREVDFEVSTFPSPDEANVRISVFRDVTERNAAQQALESANAELRTFAHAASHDLKEPLRTMANFARLIQRRYSDTLDEVGLEYLTFITDAASRGTTLVHDLLRYAELGTEAIVLEPVDLDLAAANVQQAVAARATEEGVTLTIESLPTVRATQTWAEQLLQNLVSNALKFKRPGVPPRVRVYARTSVVGHEICVEDNGIGIAPMDCERVFGIFQRLTRREEYEGNGIGLALCRRIVGKIGGDIRVESTLGRGTTFIVWLPLLEEQGAAAATGQLELRSAAA